MLIPYQVDVMKWRTPWVNYALLALIVLISLWGFSDADVFYTLAGMEETGLGGLWSDYRLTESILLWPVVAISSSFLHGGILHLAGNLLFLWVFGNAINSKFGHLGYVLFYLSMAMLAGLTHYNLTGSPGVGASGAIYAVMAAFLVFYPLNDVRIAYFFWWFLVFRWGKFELAGIFVVVAYVLWDLLMIWFGADIGVGHWAHVGGFAAGFSVALLLAMLKVIQPTEDEKTLLQLFAPRPRSAYYR